MITKSCYIRCLPIIPMKSAKTSTYFLHLGYNPYNPYCNRSLVKCCERSFTVSNNSWCCKTLWCWAYCRNCSLTDTFSLSWTGLDRKFKTSIQTLSDMQAVSVPPLLTFRMVIRTSPKCSGNWYSKIHNTCFLYTSCNICNSFGGSKPRNVNVLTAEFRKVDLWMSFVFFVVSQLVTLNWKKIITMLTNHKINTALFIHYSSLQWSEVLK